MNNYDFMKSYEASVNFYGNQIANLSRRNTPFLYSCVHSSHLLFFLVVAMRRTKGKELHMKLFVADFYENFFSNKLNVLN